MRKGQLNHYHTKHCHAAVAPLFHSLWQSFHFDSHSFTGKVFIHTTFRKSRQRLARMMAFADEDDFDEANGLTFDEYLRAHRAESPARKATFSPPLELRQSIEAAAERIAKRREERKQEELARLRSLMAGATRAKELPVSPRVPRTLTTHQPEAPPAPPQPPSEQMSMAPPSSHAPAPQRIR